MPPPRSACVLLQMSCANIAMSTHAPSWRRPARRRRDSLIMCQSCNAFCINQRNEAKNARVQYHQRRQCEIGTTPLHKYEEGLFGSEERPGRGLPDRLLEETRLRLDFMPYAERTVQPHGITLDEIHYYADILRPWIRATDPSDGRGKRKRKLIIRRDPRDISRVYFYDPELKQYFAIPYRNTAHPPISVWELREARRRLKEEGQKAVNEERIFDAYNRLRVLEAEAIHETQKARRAAQRRRDHTEDQPLRPEGVTRLPDTALASADEIQPFDEIEELNGEGWTPQYGGS